jgi:hypothetical protein
VPRDAQHIGLPYVVIVRGAQDTRAEVTGPARADDGDVATGCPPAAA